MAHNVYEMVTERLINEMQKGIIPWNKPWHGVKNGENAAISYVTRQPYSLLNQLLLGRDGEYLTFNEITKLGGKIRKGEKSSFIVFYTQYKRTEKNAEGEDEEKLTYVLRYYNVWHIDQCEGISSKITAEEKRMPETLPTAENVIAGYLSRESTLRFQNNKPSNRAFYCPGTDTVVVPMMEQFKSNGEYYSTTFHELTHSTLKKSRCNREAENARSYFGNEEYSREELVAEIGSAMLCSLTGIEQPSTFRNSVAYLQSWMRALKNDPKMMVWAAKRAEAAAQYIAG